MGTSGSDKADSSNANGDNIKVLTSNGLVGLTTSTTAIRPFTGFPGSNKREIIKQQNEEINTKLEVCWNNIFLYYTTWDYFEME